MRKTGIGVGVVFGGSTSLLATLKLNHGYGGDVVVVVVVLGILTKGPTLDVGGQ